MPPFPHLLLAPTTTTSSFSKPSSLMASSSSAAAAAAADGSKDPPSSPSPPPSSSVPAPSSSAAPSASAAAAAAASQSPSASPARSPSPLPLPAPPSSTSSRRLPPPCWTHEETLALIDSYRDKWYALRRGNLRASHWQEVADAVARRCARLPQATPKTSVQCRHKVEKLRKRYRAERLRPNTSAWPFFDRMDRMERGPLPISVRLPAPPTAAAGGGGPSSEEEEEDDDEDDEEEERIASNTRSISGILREGNWGFSRVSRNSTSKKRRAFEEEEEEDDDGDEEEEEGEGGRGEALSQLASVVRRFGEELVRMEKKRMEMLRDVERDWMEMETKRAEMVMESQRCLVDTIANAFFSLKKAKKSQDL